MTVQPVSLKLSVMLVLACLGGLVCGLLAAFVKSAVVARRHETVLPQLEGQSAIGLGAPDEDAPARRARVAF